MAAKTKAPAFLSVERISNGFNLTYPDGVKRHVKTINGVVNIMEESWSVKVIKPEEKISKCLKIKFTIEGLHNWPEAPPEYSYLAFPHRHNFNWEVSLNVGAESSREIEFIHFARTLKDAIIDMFGKQEPVEFGPLSVEKLCEMTASVLLNWGQKWSSIAVYEDNEHGAEITQ